MRGDGAKGGSGPLLAWGSLQLALGAMLALWSGGVPALLFLLSGGVVLLVAAWNRAVPAPGGPRTLSSTSLPVAVLAVGLALAAIGITAGLGLVLIGGELAAFALVWLWRELAGERRVGR